MSQWELCRWFDSIHRYWLSQRLVDCPIDLALDLSFVVVTTAMGLAPRQCWRGTLEVIWSWSRNLCQSSWSLSVGSFLFVPRLSVDTRGRMRSEVSEDIASPSQQLASHFRIWRNRSSICPPHRVESGVGLHLASTASRYSLGNSRRLLLSCINSCTFALSFGKRVLIRL